MQSKENVVSELKGVSVITVVSNLFIGKKLRPRMRKDFPKATQLRSDRGRTKPSASAYQSSIFSDVSGVSHICSFL